MSEVQESKQANFSKLPLLTCDSFSESLSAGIGTLPWPERRLAMELVDSWRPFGDILFCWLSERPTHAEM